ncbi:MAG: hypothetical protein NTU41_13775, partial [Chloroflexi bacterium]|nr:hypothetical protein [Chloroflexota bacterium]
MSPEIGESSNASQNELYAGRLANQEKLRRWYEEERTRRTVEALQKNGFTAFHADGVQKAREEILKLVPEGAT